MARRKALKDKGERKHRRTPRHPEAVAFMANANFDATEPLSVAMGLETMEEYQKATGYTCHRCGKGSWHGGGLPVCCHCGAKAKI